MLDPKPRALLLTATAALAIFLLTLGLVSSGATEAWDRAVLEGVEGAGPLHAFASVVTELGSAWVLAPVVTAVALWAHRRGRTAGAGVLVSGALVSQALSALLKWLVGRERPDWIAESLPLTHAFPSGHAMVPTVIYAMAAFLVASVEPRVRTALALLVPPLCALVGLSRIVLGVHWPTDVIGGFALGVFLAALGMLALDAAAESDRAGEEGS